VGCLAVQYPTTRKELQSDASYGRVSGRSPACPYQALSIVSSIPRSSSMQPSERRGGSRGPGGRTSGHFCYLPLPNGANDPKPDPENGIGYHRRRLGASGAGHQDLRPSYPACAAAAAVAHARRKKQAAPIRDVRRAAISRCHALVVVEGVLSGKPWVAHAVIEDQLTSVRGEAAEVDPSFTPSRASHSLSSFATKAFFSLSDSAAT
jgi:hypothetical protein